MKIYQLDHIALWVTDLDKSVDFYTQFVGLQAIPERSRQPGPGGIFRDMRLQLDRENDMGIHLFQTLHASFHVNGISPSTYIPAIGVDHYAFKVDGEFFDAAKERFEKCNCKFRFQDFKGHAGFLASRSLQFSDPDGYIIEFQHYYS